MVAAPSSAAVANELTKEILCVLGDRRRPVQFTTKASRYEPGPLSG